MSVRELRFGETINGDGNSPGVWRTFAMELGRVGRILPRMTEVNVLCAVSGGGHMGACSVISPFLRFQKYLCSCFKC